MYNDMTYHKKNKWRRGEEGKIRRGIYILPNLLTTGNLFAGFVSIISTIEGDYEKAAIAILISWVLDILDGKVARLAKATSRFGIEYDSLADLVAFGVAPGLLVYMWGLTDLERLGWLVAFAFVACGALRLARFNTMATTEAKQYFLGLPIPGAAGMVATLVLFLHPHYPQPQGFLQIMLLLVVFILSLLMVSNIHYSAFKELEFIKTRPIQATLIIVLLIVVVAARPRMILFAGLLSYVLSGPSLWLGKKLRRSREVSEEKVRSEK
ncbi:MAG: CDP-diacylglycerol--serine O-phosphatidyltransferase [Syntrophobacterales bacterium]|nr:CDP-diacylglycerol--serine O-phosphatidyltransferase [Syntrophobacterales bacterium]